MFGFISNIFTPDTVNKTVDGIYNGVDKLFYTDEEKAEATQKQIDTKLKLLPLFEPFKIAQRIIAIIFTINFILWGMGWYRYLFANSRQIRRVYLIDSYI